MTQALLIPAKFKLNANTRPTGHWIAYPRKFKRQYRLSWQLKHRLPKRRAKGWRKHVRAWKAKQ